MFTGAGAPLDDDTLHHLLADVLQADRDGHRIGVGAEA